MSVSMQSRPIVNVLLLLVAYEDFFRALLESYISLPALKSDL
jgi:hypothetical protein